MKGIRVILCGRSGNNLFQYAIGRAISERLGVPLILDSSLIDASTWKVSNHLFHLPLRAQHRRDPSPVSRWFHRGTGRLLVELFGGKVFREPALDLRFDGRLLDLKAGISLYGFFQSPLYFHSINDELQEELAPCKWSIHPAVVRRGDEIGESIAVAVHCRRGDYVNNPNVDFLGPSYFHHAMEEMRVRVPGCRFHVFSDDPAWCRLHFRGHDVWVEEHAGAAQNPLIDWYLMSHARHHILSNSSYAWWGAWFGRKRGQIAFVPPVWFKGIQAPVEEKCMPGWEVFRHL